MGVEMTREKQFFKNLLAIIFVIYIFYGHITYGVELVAPNGVMLVRDGSLSDGVGNGNWQQISQTGNLIPIYTDAPQDKAITYNGNFTLNANMDNANIIAINLARFTPGLLTVNRNTNIGSITTKANILPIQINDNATLTLYGAEADRASEGFVASSNTYVGLGSIMLNGQNAALDIFQANLGAINILNNIDSTEDCKGQLFIRGNIGIRGTIGHDKALNKINVSSSETNVNLQSIVHAAILDIIGNNNIINAVGTVIGNLVYNGEGNIVNSDKGIYGNVQFNNKGLFNLNGEIIEGDVDNMTGSDTILNFNGISSVRGEIGATNPLTEINFNVVGEVDLESNANAKNFTYNANTIVNAHSITGDNINFNNQSAVLNIENNGIINSNIIGGANSIIEFQSNGSVEGIIDNIMLLKVGSGDVDILGGNHNITEIQGNGEHHLTFADNFNLTGSINSTGGQSINLKFHGGNNNIRGIVGTNLNPVGNIEIENGITNFSNNIVAADILVKNGSTIAFSGDVTAHDISGDGNNQSSIIFNNSNVSVINSSIGQDNIINNLQIANNNVIINDSVSVNNIIFSSNHPTILTLNQLSNIGRVTTIGDNLHSLAIAQDFTSSSTSVGSPASRLKNIHLLNNSTVTIDSNNFYSGVSTSINNNGTVVFNLDNSFSYGLGTNNYNLSEVNFAGNARVIGDIYANNIYVNSGKTATFSGNNTRVENLQSLGDTVFNYNTLINSQAGINMADDTARINFSNGTLVNAQIHNGQINCMGDIWFKKDIVNASLINLAPGKVAIFEGNIIANDIIANDAKIIIANNNLVLSGGLISRNLSLDLRSNQLQLYGTITGKLNLYSFYDHNNSSGGHILLIDNSKIDLAGQDLTVKITSNSDINNLPVGGYSLISSQNDNGIVNIGRIILDSSDEQNKFIRWELDVNNMVLYPIDMSNQVLRRNFSNAALEERQFIEQLSNLEPNSKSDAALFKNQLGYVNADTEREEVSRLINRVVPTRDDNGNNNLTFAVIENIISQANNVIMNRSAELQSPAVSSGEDELKTKYGLWISPVYSQAKQKVQDRVSGYKLKSSGAVFGFDSLIKDDLILGVAYSRFNTKMSHRNQKTRDKTKGESNIFSLYGLYNFSPKLFTECILSYGKTRVKNYEGRLVSVASNLTNLETAVSRYKSTYFGGKLLGGYNYQATDKIILTPAAGLRYSRFIDGGYKESGTSFQNLTVKKRSYNKLEGILGLRANTYLEISKVVIIPEIHGYFNHNFRKKSPAIDARIGGIDAPLPSKLIKPAKKYWNVGSSLTIKYKKIECGISYNADISNKYIAHQGSLKFRVNL